ncbi:MAG: hypothetical protein IPF68_03670 [Bacteroidales bacterium]|nr:hypothetical protein [Bacteroidales bacterium]
MIENFQFLQEDSSGISPPLPGQSGGTSRLWPESVGTTFDGGETSGNAVMARILLTWDIILKILDLLIGSNMVINLRNGLFPTLQPIQVGPVW